MNLIMVRHGQSYVNLLDWDKGNIDAGLTELGQKQAAALAEWLPAKISAVDALYCSTMLRAQETAEPLSFAYGLPLICDDRLREIGNNRLDHTAWPSQDLPEYHDWWASERPFSSVARDREQGETLMHFRIRVGNFIEDLIDKYREKTVIAVCHGGVIEITHDHVFNVGPWRRCEVWTHNTGITRFQLVEHPTRETWRLHYHSRVEHLQALA